MNIIYLNLGHSLPPTCQQSWHWEVNADFLLWDTVSDGVHWVATHTQSDGLLSIGKATVAVSQNC